MCFVLTSTTKDTNLLHLDLKGFSHTQRIAKTLILQRSLQARDSIESTSYRTLGNISQQSSSRQNLIEV